MIKKTKVFKLVFFIILSFNKGISQTEIGPWTMKNKDAEEKIAKNKVKQISIYVYQARPNGKLPKKGVLTNRTTCNSLGKVLVSEMFLSSMTLKNAYEYDQFSSPIKMITYIGPDQVTEILT